MATSKFRAMVHTKEPLMLKMFDTMIRKEVATSSLAKYVGIDPATVRNWADGYTSPRLQHYRKAMEYLGYEIKLVSTDGRLDTLPPLEGQQNIAPKM